MKLVAAYLEKAIDFENMGADEPDPKLKASLIGLAAAYRKLANERAVRLKLRFLHNQSKTQPRDLEPGIGGVRCAPAPNPNVK